ncbi:MAG TPA: 4Fe-4S binding protein [bacterium]|nr:4Fe-4S binding protein [bacterium]
MCPALAIKCSYDQVVIDRAACTECLVCVSMCPVDRLGKDTFV